MPYSEIIGEGELDEQNDTWNPIFDENATKLNTALDGVSVKLPGFIIPLDYDGTGVTAFMLVPYIGASIHVPPPPANQLVLVTTERPYESDRLFSPVTVTGMFGTASTSTQLAEIGYALSADRVMPYRG